MKEQKGETGFDLPHLHSVLLRICCGTTVLVRWWVHFRGSGSLKDILRLQAVREKIFVVPLPLLPLPARRFQWMVLRRCGYPLFPFLLEEA